MNTKKSLNLLKALILAAIFTGLFVSCDNIVDADDVKYSFKPDVKTLEGTSSGIGITSKYRSDNTDYIYVFRKEVLDATSTNTSTPQWENIGIINQKALSTNNTFLFQDQFVEKDKKYVYRTVYHDSVTDEYFSSRESTEIKATTGRGLLQYNDLDLNFPKDLAYDTKASTLAAKTSTLLASDVILHTTDSAGTVSDITDFIPTLVLTKHNKESEALYSRYFPLTDKDNMSKNISYINLRDLVSDDFVNVPISIAGLVGMKMEYVINEETGEATSSVKYIYFSKVYSKLSISDSDDNSNISQFVISTFQGTGIYLPDVSSK